MNQWLRTGVVLSLACCLMGASLIAQTTQEQAGQRRNQQGAQQGQQQGQKQQGQPTPQQLEQELRQQQEVDVMQFLSRFDQNNDQMIQKNELPKRLQEDFGKVDRNSDGKLDREELREHALRMTACCDQCQAVYFVIYQCVEDPLTRQDLQHTYTLLRKMDEDNDGKITEQEIRTSQQEIRRHHAQQIMEDWDRDNDQKLTGDEIGGHLRANLKLIDQNSDGSIDMQELQRAFELRKITEKEGGDKGGGS